MARDRIPFWPRPAALKMHPTPIDFGDGDVQGESLDEIEYKLQKRQQLKCTSETIFVWML